MAFNSWGIPQELIAAILNELSEDRQTLVVCSFVSPSFREFCQKYLFKSITIHLDNRSNTRNRGLCDLLVFNPRLATHIESLTLQLNDTVDAACLAHILRALQRVRSLDLHSDVNAFSTTARSWKSFGDDFLTQLRRIIRSPELKYLCLRDIVVPFEYLRCLFQLTSLKLYRSLPVSWDDAASSFPVTLVSTEPVRQGYLEELSVIQVIESRMLMEALHDPSGTSSLSLARLRRFEAWIPADEHVQHFQQILDVASSTLESVSIIMAGTEPWFTYLDLKNLSSLTILDLKVFVMWSRTHCGPWMIRALESIPQVNNIKEVVFSPCSATDLSIEQWYRLDEILIGWSRTSVLRRVAVDLIAASRLVPQRLPKLYGNGYLTLGDGQWI